MGKKDATPKEKRPEKAKFSLHLPQKSCKCCWSCGGDPAPAGSTVGLLGLGRVCSQLSQNSRLSLSPHGTGQSTWNALRGHRSHLQSSLLDRKSQKKSLELLCQLWEPWMDSHLGGIQGKEAKSEQDFGPKPARVSLACGIFSMGESKNSSWDLGKGTLLQVPLGSEDFSLQ